MNYYLQYANKKIGYNTCSVLRGMSSLQLSP